MRVRYEGNDWVPGGMYSSEFPPQDVVQEGELAGCWLERVWCRSAPCDYPPQINWLYHSLPLPGPK
jgi:hypothetical protein